MKLSRIDLNLLVVLDAIYSEGGITRASERLHLSQPATSHALGRLRDLLNDPLFERDGRGMRPTALTRHIIGPVRQALNQLETTLSETDHFDPATMPRRFRIGVRPALESALLPALLTRIEHEAPGIDLDTVPIERQQLEADLQAGHLDAAVDAWLPTAGSLRHQSLGQDHLVVVLARSHPRIASELSLEAYLRENHVLVSSRRRGKGFEDMELSRLGHQRKIRIRCQHQATACQIVARSELLLTMPERHWRASPQKDELRGLPFPIASSAMDAHLYWHENVAADPANLWLREQLRLALMP